MKRILILLLFAVCGQLMAQNVDVTAYSQNVALRDTTKVTLDSSQRLTAAYPSVSETYQIPSYDLYGQYWDVENLRSRVLTIPFSNDRLMLILVQAANNPFEVPCVFDDISLKYGPNKKGVFHPGVDLKVDPQTLVKSCFDGVVRMAKYYGDYGLLVVIRHYNGLETVYGHLDKLCVKPGQIVKAGDVIGQTGKSGNAKDYMLHFETRFMNEYFDPELIVDFDNETLVKNTLVLMSADFTTTSLDEVGSGISTAVAKPLSKPESVSAPKVVEKPKFMDTPQSGQSTVTTPAASEQEQTISPTELQKAFDGEEEYHVVQKGESLYRIALKYNTTTAELLRLNNIPNADKIVEGQRLRVR